MHLNWIRLATSPYWLDSSIGRAAVKKPEDASSNPARDNEFFVVLCTVRLILVFHISEDGSKMQFRKLSVLKIYSIIIKTI